MDETIIVAIISAIALIIASVISIFKLQPKHKQIGTERMSNVFLIGCRIGNRVGLLSSANSSDTTGINKFLDALNQIGIQGPIISPIVETRDRILSSASFSNDEKNEIIQRYLNTMCKVPDVVQSRSPADGFRWFKLGQLLYAVATSTAIGNPTGNIPQGNVPHSICPAITALKSHKEGINLPADLQRQLEAFIESAIRQAPSE